MRRRHEQSIFGNIFLLANQLQTMIDRDFKPHKLTAKQWFLMASIGEFGKEPPTIKQVAKFMGSSHQNVKQLALKLQSNGYVLIEKDPTDGRVSRLSLTPKCHEFWQSRTEEDLAFFKKLFGSFTDEEILKLEEFLVRMNSIVRE